jgi:hypothetical protein
MQQHRTKSVSCPERVTAYVIISGFDIAAYNNVEEIKALRKQVDALIQAMGADGTHDAADVFQPTADMNLYATADYQARIKLTEAKIWLSKMLEGIGNPFPADLADKAS